ncbi:Polyketide cyclase / dehydrase and lipid transport [Botrimarina colliarenosi]|uniref:Polyketide cyclase / dehydrase and lipid transport n=1 Tax=Botrimarina colliarenosi TaxID=2528001 RepID=A0A5C6AEQ3_9BACT|nr:SRPBCC family protein [Botrimarina colliarenosi]TWT97798.1 Polyketide cyclase / dehydrase and lipid transport [Botrimarina colliarenosi]
MASLYQETLLNQPASKVWHALRDISKTHELFAGVLTDCHIERQGSEGDGVEGNGGEGDLRTVTFANGMVVRERIVAIDDQRQRIAYTVLGDMFDYHAASMQVVAVSDDACKFVWYSDLLPDSRAEVVAPLMRAGCAALRRSLDG